MLLVAVRAPSGALCHGWFVLAKDLLASTSLRRFRFFSCRLHGHRLDQKKVVAKVRSECSGLSMSSLAVLVDVLADAFCINEVSLKASRGEERNQRRS